MMSDEEDPFENHDCGTNKHDFEEDSYGWYHCKVCHASWPPWAFDNVE